MVLEQAGRIAGVEVKAAATATGKDFRGLRQLRESTGERFAAGVLIYDGENVAAFGESIYAVPVRVIWEMD
jgi:hypothetical protein